MIYELRDKIKEAGCCHNLFFVTIQPLDTYLILKN